MASTLENALAGASTGGMIGTGLGGPLGGAVGAAVGFVGVGLISYLMGAGKEEEAQRILEEAQNAYGGLSDEAIEKAAGQVLGPTRLAQIKIDPEFQAIQKDALASLGQIADSGGMTLTERADLNDVQNQTRRTAANRRQSILESLSQRGAGGSGAEVSALLAGSSDDANRESDAGLRIAANAQQRRLDAILQRAGLARGMANDDYSRQSAAATAQDAIDRFNNVKAYTSATDSYNRDVGVLDRRYGFAQNNANTLLGQDIRQTAALNNAGQYIGSAVQRAANAPAAPAPVSGVASDIGSTSQPLTPPPATPAPRVRAAGDGTDSATTYPGDDED